MRFVALYYPDQNKSLIDILMWLYDMAVYRDDLAAAKEKKETKTKQLANVSFDLG